ncbi:hypothetical protein PsorP6_016943 [Peronosclerospora sorghi]|uniref:Uncharacterized protein n=1 Tax=Peronosclerospora sorghi TaxID=230839 RepID=A0ACC0WD39_9STRA|nr:hypothetical protein PsorP6_016943 [Peronosclerospora sorghi]
MIRCLRELVSPDGVGLALPHERVLHSIGSMDALCDVNDLEIRFEELIEYRRAPFAYGGRNLLLLKEGEAFRELERLVRLKTDARKPLVVDVTLPMEGRDVLMKERLRRHSRQKFASLPA